VYEALGIESAGAPAAAAPEKASENGDQADQQAA
jgi:hypothetical protein